MTSGRLLKISPMLPKLNLINRLAKTTFYAVFWTLLIGNAGQGCEEQGISASYHIQSSVHCSILSPNGKINIHKFYRDAYLDHMITFQAIEYPFTGQFSLQFTPDLVSLRQNWSGRVWTSLDEVGRDRVYGDLLQMPLQALRCLLRPLEIPVQALRYHLFRPLECRVIPLSQP